MLVTPALATANNGNWQTAARWQRLLRGDYEVRLGAQWPAPSGANAVKAKAASSSGTAPRQAAAAVEFAPVAMIALHARRSASSIAAWAAQTPRRPLVLVLTGTDLYRDIECDAAAQQSLALADHLIVLNELGLHALPAQHRHKASVCLQSASARKALVKTGAHLRALMVGHLREEKDPRTYFAAAELLQSRSDLRLDHIGAPLDASLGAQAQALMQRHRGYRWFGNVAHEAARRAIQAAHVLVHCSRIEGGAHVVIEALRSGTPVLASRIAGNVGLLGPAYEGYFEPGDAQGLAKLLQCARDEPAMLARLQAQARLREALFSPERERESLLQVLRALLPTGQAGAPPWMSKQRTETSHGSYAPKS